MMKAAQVEIKRGLRRGGDRKPNHRETVEKTLEDFFFLKTQSRPVILPNIVRV